MQIQKGMYGLKQAGKIANDQLKTFFAPHGYRPTQTPGLWKHDNKPISFTLIVDDFSVMYTNKKYAQDLMKILGDNYEDETNDWTGSLYSGIRFDWDYTKCQVHLSMPGYVRKAMVQFQHEFPENFTTTSHLHTPPVYRNKVQLAQQDSTAPLLDKADNTKVRQVVGQFLFYAQAIGSNLLMGLNAIASKQEHATDRTAALVTHILNYCATFPDAVLTFKASDMILHIQSDASYLSEPKAKSRGGGYFSLSNAANTPTDAPHNAPIYCFCQV